MRAIWHIPEWKKSSHRDAFEYVAQRQTGDAANLLMNKKGQFLLRTESGNRLLGECTIEILRIREQVGKKRYCIQYYFCWKKIKCVHLEIELNFKTTGICRNKPRFASYAQAAGFDVFDSLHFNQACLIYFLAALVIYQGTVIFTQTRSGWYCFQREDRESLDYIGVTQNFDNGKICNSPIKCQPKSPLLVNYPDDSFHPVSGDLGEAHLCFLDLLSCRDISLIWAFTVHSVTWHAIRRICQMEKKPLCESSHSLNICGQGKWSAAKVANVFCPCIWRPHTNRRYNSLAADEVINLGRATDRISKFSGFSDGIFFVADKRTGNIKRGTAIRQLFKEYITGESTAMPVFVTVKPFSPCELWSVDVSVIQIEPGIPVQELKQAGFDLLVAYIDYLATHCRTVLASRTLESESSPVDLELMELRKNLLDDDSEDPDEIGFALSLYHSALWFALFLQDFSYHWKPFIASLRAEIEQRCKSCFVSDPQKQLGEDVVAQFCRWVLDMFETRRSKFSGIMWEGVEKRRNDAAAFYLEGKPLENAFFRATGFSVTLDLRNTLTLNGILLRRTHQSSVVQERKPPAEVCAKFKDRLNRNGKASVWVLSKDAVLRYAEKS